MQLRSIIYAYRPTQSDIRLFYKTQPSNYYSNDNDDGGADDEDDDILYECACEKRFKFCLCIMSSHICVQLTVIPDVSCLEPLCRHTTAYTPPPIFNSYPHCGKIPLDLYRKKHGTATLLYVKHFDLQKPNNTN